MWLEESTNAVFNEYRDMVYVVVPLSSTETSVVYNGAGTDSLRVLCRNLTSYPCFNKIDNANLNHNLTCCVSTFSTIAS